MLKTARVRDGNLILLVDYCYELKDPGAGYMDDNISVENISIIGYSAGVCSDICLDNSSINSIKFLSGLEDFCNERFNDDKKWHDKIVGKVWKARREE